MSKTDIIPIVDDVEMNRAILNEIFRHEYRVLEAENGRQALAHTLAYGERITAILLDLHMPGMSGEQYLQRLKTSCLLPGVPIFVITADSSESTKLAAFDLGITDVIEKPFNSTFLHRRVNSQIELYRTNQDLKYLTRRQEAELARRAEEYSQLNLGVISALAVAIEFRSGETGMHVKHISHITRGILKRLRTHNALDAGKLSDEDIEDISYAAILHDVGKISIADSILNKPGKLTDAEFETMKTHTVKGAELIDNIAVKNNQVLDYARDICLHHHERVDGRGYPDHLKGNQITTWSKVVSIADVFDALTQDRCYKKACSKEKAIAMILNGECGAFEDELVDAFLDVVSQY